MYEKKKVVHATTHCELCRQPRETGSFLIVKRGEDPIWVCEDCRRMLELRVDDQGTAGD